MNNEYALSCFHLATDEVLMAYELVGGVGIDWKSEACMADSVLSFLSEAIWRHSRE